ncbi:hypothetical protein N0O92_15625 [Alkalihalobacillus sp. MEB130]|uniref:hypothetical protein n=1 Tax=Alkalihalobacillus sp. MEB130 TaxID=2976704 RepID=UPI0028DEC3BD|nr:hypothetical protein [Alkalihalobacillus sp. MEB130]MDT8861648.1 hypothetical protein [Alkalihalobacillus sp. MEB130]
MSRNNFEESMERLNKYYNEMPTKSSSANIMANIKKKKKRNWSWARSYKRWQVAALVVFTLGIGYVLGASQLSGENESAMPLESTADAPMESMSITMADEEHDQEEAMEESRILESFGNEDELKTISIVDEEGMEDEKVVNKLEVEGFSFTTFYDANFEMEQVSNEQGHSVQIYANYGDGRVEPVLFEVYKFTESLNYDQQVASYKAMMSDAGYTEVETSNYMTSFDVPGQVVEEFMFHQDGVYVHVIPVEHTDGYYFMRASSYSIENVEMIEFNEGFGREVRIIFEQFNWIYE